MEFCDGGSLLNLMTKLGINLSENQISLVLKDMLTGLEYLHAQKMIHRDIKADNVLLTDQGVSKLGWPKIPSLNFFDNFFFDLPVMRALFVIATGTHDPPSLTEKAKWSSEFHDFISHCLVKNPKERATASQLLQHPFIKNSPATRDVLKELAQKYISYREQKAREKEAKVCSRISFFPLSLLPSPSPSSLLSPLLSYSFFYFPPSPSPSPLLSSLLTFLFPLCFPTVLLSLFPFSATSLLLSI